MNQLEALKALYYYETVINRLCIIEQKKGLWYLYDLLTGDPIEEMIKNLKR